MPEASTPTANAGDNSPSLQDPQRPGCLWAGLTAIGLWFVHFLALAMFTLASAVMGQQFARVFDDLGVDLSPTVELVVFLSNLVFNYWYLLFVLLLLIDGPVLLALQLLPARQRWIARLWFRGWLVVILAMTGITMLFMVTVLGGVVRLT